MKIVHLSAHLVPSFSFGENDIYNLVLSNEPGSKIRQLQRTFQRITGITPLMFSGKTAGVLKTNKKIEGQSWCFLQVVGSSIIHSGLFRSALQ